MNIRTNEDRPSLSRTAEEAGMWDARLRAPDCTEEDRERFAVWCEADPAHRESFERLQNIVATLRHDRGRADVRALRDEALRIVQRRSRKLWAVAAAASFVVVAIGLIAFGAARTEWLSEPVSGLVAWVTGVETHTTGTAERSTFVLTDGSTVELNSRSHINVRFSESRRHIEVVQGQALFSVAKNKHRPFVVDAGSRRIVALGTQFDVRLDNRSVQVTLLEGKVRVGDAVSGESDLTGEAVELMPGKQLVSRLPDPNHANATAPGAEVEIVVRDIDVSKVAAWREGDVFLNDVSLAEAVEEMNKHSVLQIRVESAALADLHVNGLFKAGSQESFVAALEEYFPLAAQRRSDREIVLTAR